jgi:hypothetical protein
MPGRGLASGLPVMAGQALKSAVFDRASASYFPATTAKSILRQILCCKFHSIAM